MPTFRNQIDRSGRTASSYAEARGYFSIVNVLEAVDAFTEIAEHPSHHRLLMKF